MIEQPIETDRLATVKRLHRRYHGISLWWGRGRHVMATRDRKKGKDEERAMSQAEYDVARRKAQDKNERYKGSVRETDDRNRMNLPKR